MADIPSSEECQEQFQEFLQNRSDHINEEGENLLILYVYHASDIKNDTVAHLLTLNAVNHKDEDGETVLFKACFRNDVNLVRQLLEAGADVQHRDNDGGSVLLQAATSSNGSPISLFQLLVQAGADVNVRDESGASVLGSYLEFCEDPQSDVVLFLLKAGFKVEYLDEEHLERIADEIS